MVIVNFCKRRALRIAVGLTALVLILVGGAGAVSINFGETVSGSIDFAGDNGTYTFSASSGDTILIRMGSTWYSGPEIKLLAPNGTLISYASGYGTYFSELIKTLPDTGVYTIQAGDNGGDNTGSYGIYFQRLGTSNPIQITNPNANPVVILNDNGRARPPGSNITRLNVTVTGDTTSVTIDLSPIGGSNTAPMTKISGTDIYTTTTNAISGINLTNNLVVNATDTSGNFNNSVSIPLTVLLRGDIVRDNKIDLKDLLYLRKYIAGLEPSINPLVADIQPAEGDGKVDLKDLLLLRKYLAGLEPLI